MRRFARIALLALCTAASTAHSAPATYPAGPVRLVVGFAPGGGSDVLARIIAQKMTDTMGYPWVVDNRPGAGGNLSTDIVARANPDGHTVLIALNTQLTANPGIYKVSFRVDRDFQPVTMVASSDQMLVVHPSIPATTLKEFIALAKQKPGAFSYSSAGVGTVDHLGIELLNRRTGINTVHVPYKGGAPASASVLAGETHMRIGSVASTIPYVAAGRLRGLAIASGKRSKLAPEIPTIAESGYPDLAIDVWYALMVPSATARSTVDQLRSQVHRALEYPDVQTAMERGGLNPVASSSSELAVRIKNEAETLARVIKDAGIRAD